MPGPVGTLPWHRTMSVQERTSLLDVIRERFDKMGKVFSLHANSTVELSACRMCSCDKAAEMYEAHAPQSCFPNGGSLRDGRHQSEHPPRRLRPTGRQTGFARSELTVSWLLQRISVSRMVFVLELNAKVPSAAEAGNSEPFVAYSRRASVTRYGPIVVGRVLQ